MAEWRRTMEDVVKADKMEGRQKAVGQNVIEVKEV